MIANNAEKMLSICYVIELVVNLLKIFHKIYVKLDLFFLLKK